MRKSPFISPLVSLGLLAILLLLTASQCNGDDTPEPVITVKRWQATIQQRYPHRRDSFTQGLLFHDGVFYESDGLSARYGGQSSLRRVTLLTGAVEDISHVNDQYFAEGLALVGDELIQLTWKAGKAFVYDRATLQPKRTLEYTGEGWGLCFDGAALYMSDGSSTLYKRNASSFAIEDRIAVRLNGQVLENLNELECVGDYVYANVWQTTQIVRIHKETGQVDAVIEAKALLEEAQQVANGERIDVLNGIAYNAEAKRFYLTGKLWPLLFEVTFD